MTYRFTITAEVEAETLAEAAALVADGEWEAVATDTYAEALAAAVGGTVIETGGGCQAILIGDQEGQHVLITNGDAGLPDPGNVAVTFFADYEDEGTTLGAYACRICGRITTPSPDAARCVCGAGIDGL